MVESIHKTLLFVLVMVSIVLVSMTAISANGSLSQPLSPAATSITRSITFPFLTFMGKPDSNLTESVTWYQNGSTKISDSRGNSLTFGVPLSQGVSFTLLQNSTTIDQKFIGPSLQYDILWKPVQNSKGIVDKYKFVIVGTSASGTEIQFPIKTSEKSVVTANRFMATNNVDTNSTLGGLAIDWSDAISAGYKMKFDSVHSSLGISVGPAFSIDPTVVATGVPSVSPYSIDYSEGERRIVNIGGNIFAFYYDASNLVYRNSTNGGTTWSSSHLVGTGTGTIPSDSTRWSIGSSTCSGKQYVSVVYWTQSGTNILVNYTRGYVAPNSFISWNTTKTLLTLPIPTGYSSAYPAANEVNDTNGNLFLTVRYLNNSPIYYYHKEFKSTDCGNSFSLSGGPTSTNSVYRPDLVLARLANGNMLLTQALYTSSELSYSVYSSSNSSWHSFLTTSSAGMTVNVVKQISADSNRTNAAFVAYVTGNHSGTLKVAKWSNNGAFSGFETANSTLSHSLPSITITRNNVTHIFTLSSGKVWETDKIGSSWFNSANPFGTTFNSPDDITAGISYPAALWIENSGTPYNLMFGLSNLFDKFGVKELYPTKSGGKEWYSNWDDKIARDVPIPPCGGGSCNTDPYDTLVHATGYSKNPGKISIDGNGIAKLIASSDIGVKLSQPRIYVRDLTNATLWNDTEVTIYGKRVSEDMNDSSAGFQLARGDHYFDTTQPCVDTYYSRMTYGVVNSNGVPTDLNVNNFKKELTYPQSTSGQPTGNNNFTNHALPVGQWIGHKFIYQHKDSGTHVHMEMWVDKSSNGANGGTWQKVINYNDTGGWTTVGCGGHPNDYIITELAHDIFTRNTGITEADYKWFSAREINPLP